MNTSTPLQFGPDILLLDRLAAGGMAEVYRAKQIGTAGFEKTVALKRILPEFASRPEFKEMFQREMNLCARLQHPNVVQVFKNGEYEGYLYLLMEFVDGKTIADLISRARELGRQIPPAIACYLVSEVAKGLDYAHRLVDEDTGEALGLVHRDISPQNIMLSYNGEVKVVDFGIAKAATGVDLTRTGDLKGKIPYISPEQIEGKRLDYRSDIFSLGVVFYELLTGSMLFAGSNTYATIKIIAECKIPSLKAILPDLPEPLIEIVMTALERDRDNRYQSAGDLHRDLSLFMNRFNPGFVPADFTDFMQQAFHQKIGEEREKRRVYSSALSGALTKITQSLSETGADHKSETRESPASFQRTQLISHALALEETGPSPSESIHNRIPLSYFIAAVLLGITVALIIPFLFRPKVAQEVAVNYKPEEIPGLISWYDASTLKGRSNSDIDVWKDLSPNQYNAVQPLTSSRPQFIQNGPGNKPAVVFDGYDDYLTGDRLVNSLRHFTSMSVIVVARSLQDKTQFLWSFHLADKSTDLARVGFVVGSRFRAKATKPIGNDYYDSEPFNTNELSVYSTIIESSELNVYRNSKKIVSRVLPAPLEYNNVTYFSIGQEYDGGKTGDYFRGEISEFLLYGIALSPEQRDLLERALVKKYKIGSQPN